MNLLTNYKEFKKEFVISEKVWNKNLDWKTLSYSFYSFYSFDFSTLSSRKIKLKVFTLLTVLLLTTHSSYSQKNVRVGAIGFYNLENLFDTEDHPDKIDEEFTPTGKRLWHEEIYWEKQQNLAKVVSEMGTELSPDGLAILGVAEVENRKVLEDFVKQDKIKGRKYQIVHFESPDRRGIDVALLYQSKYYKVSESKAIPLLIYNDQNERVYTRDILLVGGSFDGDPLYILVNHWPSRSGGESATRAFRNAGALRCKEISDSLSTINPAAKVIIMGDLNDDPVSPSVKKILQAQSQKKKVRPKGFYNPMFDFYKKGFGTNAYRDAWSLFDQIILNYPLIRVKGSGYKYYRTHIHNPTYLIQKKGRYKGYPFRTFNFDQYMGGYSDHFPVYVYLVKEVEQ